MDCENTFYGDIDAFTTKGQPATFVKSHVTPPTSDQILERDAIAGIPFYAAKAGNGLVLKTVMAQHK